MKRHSAGVFFRSMPAFTPDHCIYPLSSTWPHLNSDVGLEEGEY